MRLNLREIIELPGGKLPFDISPDLSEIAGGSVKQVKDPVRASGSVTNNAGMLQFTCRIETVLRCECARCLKEFDYPVDKTITAAITESGAGENPDAYYLQGDEIDAQEIITTELLLQLSDKLLCRSGCAGLCQRCGKDLNDGECDCGKEPDPRLSVLKQLLE